MVTDIRLFCEEFSNTLCGGRDGTGGVYEGVGNIVWYSYQTWHRSGPFGICVAFGWSTLVFLGNAGVINLVAPWVFRQERIEAMFRCLCLAQSHACPPAVLAVQKKHRKSSLG